MAIQLKFPSKKVASNYTKITLETNIKHTMILQRTSFDKAGGWSNDFTKRKVWRKKYIGVNKHHHTMIVERKICRAFYVLLLRMLCFHTIGDGNIPVPS